MKIVKKNNVYFLNIDNKVEEKDISNFINKDIKYNLQDNSLIISLKEASFKNETLKNIFSIKQKIISLLNEPSLGFQEKVEGNFEKLLNKEDLLIFKEMVKNKEIELFKLSSKYKKGIYKVVEKNLEKDNFNNNYKDNLNNNFQIMEKNIFLKKTDDNESFSLFDKNKYIILKDNLQAKEFSEKYVDLIKSKEIIGIKSFDNNYYVIYRYLLEDVKNSLLSLNLKDVFTIDFLEKELKISKDLIKVTIEILKEEGLIIERKKNNFSIV